MRWGRDLEPLLQLPSPNGYQRRPAPGSPKRPQPTSPPRDLATGDTPPATGHPRPASGDPPSTTGDPHTPNRSPLAGEPGEESDRAHGQGDKLNLAQETSHNGGGSPAHYQIDPATLAGSGMDDRHATADTGDVSNLEQLLLVLRRRWKLLLGCIVLAAAAAVGFSLLQRKEYTSTA